MKNYLLLFSLFVFQNYLLAQSIPNADFENWNSVSFEDPSDWYSSNSYTVPTFGTITVSKVTGFIGQAVRIETFIMGTDTSTGYISNTTGDPVIGEGGVPYSEQPTAITGYFRYDLPGADSAILLVIFKNSGVIISSDFFMIKGTGSEPNYVPFSFPLTLASTPDTVIIAATCSNLISNLGITDGSWIEYDELAFTGPSISQAIPGGDMENWHSTTLSSPIDWFTFGNGISQSSDAHSGSYALSLMTTDQGSFPQISGATTGQNSYGGGQPYTNTSDTLLGFYKYLTTGSDTASISVMVSANSSWVGGGFLSLPPTSVYTPIFLPFSSFSTPDTMKIDIYSSSYPFDSARIGSELIIDNLQLQSVITGLKDLRNHNSHLFSVYPNPVSDIARISYTGQIQDIESKVYNSLGELVIDLNSENNDIQLNMSQLPKGLYWLKMVSGTNVSVRKIIKQ